MRPSRKARAGEVSAGVGPRFAFVLPHLPEKRRPGQEEGGGGSRERIPPVCALCSVRRQALSPPASRPPSPTMEQALIVLNVDYSRATAPWGQILAKMIDRPWRGEQMMFESTAPGENQSGAERKEHVCLFVFVSAGSCSREVEGRLPNAQPKVAAG